MNYLAILVAAIVSVIVGMLWYGPFFGKTWIKLSKISKSEMKRAKEKGMAKEMIINFIGVILMAYVLSLAVANYGALSIGYGIRVAFLIWLGFIATVTLNTVLWEGKSWKLYFLNNSYNLVNLIIMAIIISAWN